MYQYFAYGLKINSEIELFELVVDEFSAECDLEIKFSNVPQQIAGSDWYNSSWQKNDDFFKLRHRLLTEDLGLFSPPARVRPKQSDPKDRFGQISTKKKQTLHEMDAQGLFFLILIMVTSVFRDE